MNTEAIRKFCLGLKGCKEDIKWGNDLCFTIGEKMFCVCGMNEGISVSFKCSDEDFELLIERDGIIPAPYMARNKWVMVQKASALTQSAWKEFIFKSYHLIAGKLPKKTQRELGFIS